MVPIPSTHLRSITDYIALSNTIRLMAEIDAVIEQHGGSPPPFPLPFILLTPPPPPPPPIPAHWRASVLASRARSNHPRSCQNRCPQVRPQNSGANISVCASHSHRRDACTTFQRIRNQKPGPNQSRWLVWRLEFLPFTALHSLREPRSYP
jgi:hypothetical protein